MTQFNESFYEKHPDREDFLEEYIVPTARDALVEVKNWPGQERIYEKLKSHYPFFIESIRQLYVNREAHQYRILCHGDYHFKNMMCRNDGMKSEDYLLVGGLIFII